MSSSEPEDHADYGDGGHYDEGHAEELYSWVEVGRKSGDRNIARPWKRRESIVDVGEGDHRDYRRDREDQDHDEHIGHVHRPVHWPVFIDPVGPGLRVTLREAS